MGTESHPELEHGETTHITMNKDTALTKNLPPAFVPSTSAEILCPFALCDKEVHGRDHSTPIETNLNSRIEHCYQRRLNYRFLFPYDDDHLVRDFGFFLDRHTLEWTMLMD